MIHEKDILKIPKKYQRMTEKELDQAAEKILNSRRRKVKKKVSLLKNIKFCIK